MRSVHVAGLVVLASCWTSVEPPTTPEPPRRPAGLFTMSEASLGPLHGSTKANLVALRRAFAGFQVRPVNDDDTLEYHVFAGDDLVLFVVPDDDGSIFNAHATSPKVAVAGRGWRVGARFRGASELTNCECWGDNPTCWVAGEHIAVNFARACTDVTNPDADLHILDGATIQRLIWNPKGFAGQGP